MNQHSGNQGSQQPERWVCPSDRQLALRAKLGTGWSFRSNQPYSSRKTDVITAEELDSINKVVDRAARLMQVESRRLGVLVARLENLEDSAAGDGVNECRLCQKQFGLLGSKKTTCERCGKATCKKCGISFANALDAVNFWVCKVCSEEREFWKRSGAWFYKGVPPFIKPGSDKPEKVNESAFSSSTDSAHTNTQLIEQNTTVNSPAMAKVLSRVVPAVDHADSYSCQSESDSDDEDANGRTIRHRRPVKIKQYVVGQP